MAFPQIADRNSGNSTGTAASSHTVNLPPNIASGNLLVVVFGHSQNVTVGWPAGWDELWDVQAIGRGMAAAYRQADGGEGSTITVTTSGDTQQAHLSYRFTGAENPATQPPEFATPVTTLDPPSLTPTGGAKDYLWFAVHNHDADGAITGWPANYADPGDQAVSTGGASTSRNRVAATWRELNAASEDPGAFSTTGSSHTTTLVIHPASAVAPTEAEFPAGQIDVTAQAFSIAALVQAAFPPGGFTLTGQGFSVTTETGPPTEAVFPAAQTGIQARSFESPNRTYTDFPGAPVLLRIPRGLSAIFHEVVSPSGDTYHPVVEDWVAEEEAPGGYGPQSGIISERVWAAHRDIFRAGSYWRAFTESDAHCVAAGRMLEPEVSGAVRITSRGPASRADREIDRLVLQTRDVGAWREFSGDSTYWSSEQVTLAAGTQAGQLRFTRAKKPSGEGIGGEIQMMLWLPRQPLTRIAFTLDYSGPVTSGALVRVLSTKTGRNQGEPEISTMFENWVGNPRGSSVGTSPIAVDVDLTLGSNLLSIPNANGDNRGDPGDTGVGFVFPDLVAITVGDDIDLSAAANEPSIQVDVSRLRVNGDVGDADRMTAAELVLMMAGRLGMRFTDIQPTGVNVLPYELWQGTVADVLDYAFSLTGWPWLIQDTGSNRLLRFRPYNDRVWTLSSPWTPLEIIPEERFDHVKVPFVWSDGETLDAVSAYSERRLDRRNSYGLLSMENPAPDEERARAFGERVVEALYRPEWSGQATLSEVEGPDGFAVDAHHVHAGDRLQARMVGGPGRLDIASVSRSYDAVEVSFDGRRRMLEKLLSRRERRVAKGAHV